MGCSDSSATGLERDPDSRADASHRDGSAGRARGPGARHRAGAAPRDRRSADPRRRRRRQPSRRPAAHGQLPAAARRFADPRPRGLRHRRRARRGGRPDGMWATRSARSSPAAAMPNTASRRRRNACRCRRALRSSTPPVCPRPSSPSGPTSSIAAGSPRGESFLVHGGVERHRHDGDPARPRLRRARLRHRRQPGEMRRLPRARRRARDRLPAGGFRRRRQGSDTGQGRRRHPRHGRRPLCREEFALARGRRPARADRLSAGQQGDRSTSRI